MSSKQDNAQQPPRGTPQAFTGIPVSRGLVSGTVCLARAVGVSAVSEARLQKEHLAPEVKRLDDAFTETKAQIAALADTLKQQVGGFSMGILDGYLMMIDDSLFIDSCKKKITRKLHNAEWAVNETGREFAAIFDQMEDAYLSERSKDVGDIVKRILRNLQGMSDEPRIALGDQPCVIVADELFPSETLALPKHLILGIATDHGSTTSHASLLARALNIPAVVGLGRFSEHTRTGDPILLDGASGMVILHPDSSQQQAFEEMRAQVRTNSKALKQLSRKPGATRDGHAVPLLANVDIHTPIKEMSAVHAEGIGLFRTEYQWLALNREPTEDEQYHAYMKMAQAMTGNRKAVIRALDLGGDKMIGDDRRKEANPFLGNRSIRLLLNTPEVFRRQLRAILRASAHGNVAVMYPMVSALEELRAANRALASCMEQLRAEGIAFDPGLKCGVMIETPSAALIADALGKETDFFSIGSNDLIQYTLAVDRLNEEVSHLYQPTHPAVLKLIELTVHAGLANGCPVTVCGEMAADPVLAVLLVGYGVNELSMTPSQIPHVKYALSRITRKEAQALAEQVCAMTSETADCIYASCRERLSKQAPDLSL